VQDSGISRWLGRDGCPSKLLDERPDESALLCERLLTGSGSGGSFHRNAHEKWLRRHSRRAEKHVTRHPLSDAFSPTYWLRRRFDLEIWRWLRSGIACQR